MAYALRNAVVQRLKELNLDRLRGSRRQLSGDRVLALLVQPQHFESPLDHAHRQARQARDFDAIATVSLTRLDFSQEDNTIAGFLYRDAQVANAVQFSG